MNTWKELVFSDEEKGHIQGKYIDTPFSTTMGAPKFLSRFRELMETKIGLTIDMGGTEIGEATKSRGHKDPSGTRVYNKIGTASMQAKKQEHRVADRPRAKSSQS